MQINKIDHAVELIDENDNCEVLDVSSIYETSPYGEVEQDEFFNCVIKIKTYFDPNELFHFLKSVEQELGRKARTRWGPREIDLDILFYNDIIYSDGEITIPHKDLLNRDFVLVPLNEIAPDFVHPELGKKISEIIIFQPETGKPSVENNKSHIIRKIPHKVLLK